MYSFEEREYKIHSSKSAHVSAAFKEVPGGRVDEWVPSPRRTVGAAGTVQSERHAAPWRPWVCPCVHTRQQSHLCLASSGLQAATQNTEVEGYYLDKSYCG